MFRLNKDTSASQVGSRMSGIKNIESGIRGLMESLRLNFQKVWKGRKS